MKINVETTVAAPIEQVWRAYTTPAEIKQWNAASDDWHTTAASVDLREGGAFSSRMEAKDGSMGFDFAGTYTKIVEHKLISSAPSANEGSKLTRPRGGRALQNGRATKTLLFCPPHPNGRLGKPETFNFLGFTFICGTSSGGQFQIKRKTRRDRMRAKLKEIKEEMRQR